MTKAATRPDKEEEAVEDTSPQTAVTITRAPSRHIANLSLEVLDRILRFVSPASSASFGVTCRLFYEIHWRLNGRVALNSPGFAEFGGRLLPYSLRHLLRDWMGDRWFCFHHKCFHDRFGDMAEGLCRYDKPFVFASVSRIEASEDKKDTK